MIKNYEKQNNTNFQKSTLQKFLEKPRDNLNDLNPSLKAIKAIIPI